MPNVTAKKKIFFLHQPIVLHFILGNYDWNIIKSGFMKMLLRERENKKKLLRFICIKLRKIDGKFCTVVNIIRLVSAS